MKKSLLLLFSFLLAFGMTGVASALTLSSVEGSWSNVIGGSYVNYPMDQYVDYGNHAEDQVRWGRPATWSGQSGLGFTGVSPPDTSFDIGVSFEIGQLRHFNNPIYNAATSADLRITLAFSDPSGLDGAFDFSFQINETPNTTGGSPGDDDFITFPSSFPEGTLDIGGISYTLELLGFGPDANNLINFFQSPEGTTNATLMWGRITTPHVPVPEPSTMLLLGSGLVGLIGFRRRFSK